MAVTTTTNSVQTTSVTLHNNAGTFSLVAQYLTGFTNLGVASVSTTPGSYTVAPTGVVFSAPPGTGATTATGTVQTTGTGPYTVTGVTLTSPGSGYISAPTVTFTGGTATTAATGTATLQTSGPFTAYGSIRFGSYTVASGETVASAYQHLLDQLNTASGLSLSGSTSNGTDVVVSGY